MSVRAGRIGRVAVAAAMVAAASAAFLRGAGAGEVLDSGLGGGHGGLDAVGIRDYVHDYIPPRGRQAIGYGPGGLAGLGYGHGAWYAWPYRTKSALYGYPDFAHGRGPLINLGGAALQPGFRGYGVVGSPGYGLGMYPSTWTDQRPVLWHGDGYHRGR